MAPPAVAGAVLLFLGSPAHAYPIPRDGAEIPVSWDNPVLRAGQWVIDDSTTLRRPPKNRRRGIYIVDAPTAGLMRARIRQARDAQLSILFRMEVLQRSPLTLRGYGLSLNVAEGTARFLRWDAGGLMDTGVGVTSAELRSREDLEVVLTAVGPTFVAVIYDGGSKQPVAVVTWSDASYANGVLGMHAHRVGNRSTSVEMWVSTVNLPAQPGWEGRAQPVAPQWSIAVAELDLSRLPSVPGLYRRVRGAEPPGVAALISTEVGVHLLREANIRPQRAQAGVPYAYRDPGFYGRQANAAEITARGVQFTEDHKDAAMIESIVRAFAAAHPESTRLLTLGSSSEGRPILGLRIGDDPTARNRPTVLLVGAHHANEIVTPDFVLDAVQVLLTQPRSERASRWMAQLTVIAVPMVNPDGSHAFWHVDERLGRKNRRGIGDESFNRGVDLNRNYPFRWGGRDTKFKNDIPTSPFFRGPGPRSEREVQAMIELAQKNRFVAAISYHAAATRLLVPYTIPGVDNPEPSAAWTVAGEMLEHLDHRFGRRRYEAVRALYPVDGTEQDWYYHTFGTLAYLVEVPYRRPNRARHREAIEHSRPAWQTLFDRILDGPTLAVVVVDDATGEPVEAGVRVAEIDLRAGETWSTDPNGGRWNHVLPEPGDYTVVVRKDGRVVRRQTMVGSGITRVRVRIPAAAQ